MTNPLDSKESTQKIPFVLKCGFCIMFVLFLLSLFCISYKREYSFKYDENSNLDYRVYLKKNDFYPKEYLEMDNAYISSLVDYVDINMNYTFFTKEKILLNYNYKIIATINVKNTSGKSILKKDEILYDNGTKKVNEDNIFNIKENIKIKYDKYNEIAKKFIEEYKLTGVEASVDVKLLVGVGGQSLEYNEDTSSKSVILLNIPLATSTTEFSISYSLSNESDVVLQHKETLIRNKGLFYLIVTLAIFDVLGMIVTIIIIINTRNARERFEVELKRIKKVFDEYICETNYTENKTDMEKTKSMKIVSIKKFDDLINAADKINKPILYFEDSNSVLFYIYDDRVCYMYSMSVKDFE